MYPSIVITYGDPKKQLKLDALTVIRESGQEPLKNAIACALRLRQSADLLQKAIDAGVSDEDRGKLALALARCLPDEFNAWIKVAEFVYAKPKHLEVSGSVTLEQLLAGSWDQPAQNLITGAGS